MAERFINIRFPFRDSEKGYYLDMTKTDRDAIKSNLIHLLLTNKGERLYLPEFGANLRRIIFEPRISETKVDIKNEIQSAIDKFIPGLQVNEVNVDDSEDNEHAVIVRIDYTITEGTFKSSDFIILEL